MSESTPVDSTATPDAENTSPLTSFLGKLSVINYYPEANAWMQMWDSWDPATIDSDFGIIKQLNANTVRVFVQPDAFGYPQPSPTMQAELASVFSMAAAHGLKVWLTLFDEWDNYTDIQGSEAWAKAILAPYAGQPDLAVIELKNELDPSDGAAVSWAKTMLPYVQTIAAGTPVTISAADMSRFTALVQALGPVRPDFYDLHYYDKATLAYATFEAAQKLVSPAALFIGETGFSTWTGTDPIATLPDTQANLEAYQDYYLRQIELAARSLNLPYAAPWTLHDFLPSAMSPGSESDFAQQDYGLLRTDGTEKPAAATIASIFAGNAIDTWINGGFEQSTDTSNGPEPLLWMEWHAAEATFAWDPTVSHSGQASASISDSTGDSSGVPSFYTSPIATIIPGDTYEAQVWARGQNATGGTRIALSWDDAQDNYIGQDESGWLPAGTTGWTLLQVEAVAPPGAAYAEIDLKSSYNTGTAWFDDVTFTALSSP